MITELPLDTDALLNFLDAVARLAASMASPWLVVGGILLGGTVLVLKTLRAKKKDPGDLIPPGPSN